MSTFSDVRLNPAQPVMDLVGKLLEKDLLKRLRNDILSMNKMVDGLCNIQTDINKAKETFQQFSDKVEHQYEKFGSLYLRCLEANTNEMHRIREFWHSAEMGRLHTLLLDALVEPESNRLYEKALKVSNSWETIDQFNRFTLEFLKTFSNVVNRHRVMPNITPDTMIASQTKLDVEIKYLQEVHHKGNKFRLNWLERNAYGGLLEVRMCHVISPSQQVDLIKFAMVVNNGNFDYVVFVAPHEEWTYLVSTHRVVDIHKGSKYEYYKKLNNWANSSWLPNFGAALTTIAFKGFIGHCVNMVSFESRCKTCSRFLNNFALPMLEKTDRRIHDTCRF